MNEKQFEGYGGKTSSQQTELEMEQVSQRDTGEGSVIPRSRYCSPTVSLSNPQPAIILPYP